MQKGLSRRCSLPTHLERVLEVRLNPSIVILSFSCHTALLTMPAASGYSSTATSCWQSWDGETPRLTPPEALALQVCDREVVGKTLFLVGAHCRLISSLTSRFNPVLPLLLTQAVSYSSLVCSVSFLLTRGVSRATRLRLSHLSSGRVELHLFCCTPFNAGIALHVERLTFGAQCRHQSRVVFTRKSTHRDPN